MQVYPSYTLKKIKRELSWRKFQELTKEWNENPPMYFVLRGLVEGLVGKSIGQKEKKNISPDTILKRLQVAGESIVLRKKK